MLKKVVLLNIYVETDWIVNVFTVTFDQLNASLLNNSIKLFKNK